MNSRASLEKYWKTLERRRGNVQVTLELNPSQIDALADVSEIPFDKKEPYEIGAAIGELLNTFIEFSDDDVFPPDSYRDILLHVPSNICGMFLNYVGVDPNGGIGMGGYMFDDEEIQDGSEIVLPYGPPEEIDKEMT